MAKGKKTGGRQKGSTNKFTTFKADLIKAWEETGGYDRLVEWMGNSDNTRDVVTVMAKLLPKPVEITGEDGGPIQTDNNWTINIVDSQDKD